MTHPVRDLADALAQIDRMRQALNDIRRLHRPIPSTAYDGQFVCFECCTDDGETTTVFCYDADDHRPGQPLCPTAAILDRVGL